MFHPGGVMPRPIRVSLLQSSLYSCCANSARTRRLDLQELESVCTPHLCQKGAAETFCEVFESICWARLVVKLFTSARHRVSFSLPRKYSTSDGASSSEGALNAGPIAMSTGGQPMQALMVSVTFLRAGSSTNVGKSLFMNLSTKNRCNENVGIVMFAGT